MRTCRGAERLAGSRHRLRTRQVGVFGHSFGGATAAQVMLNDTRFVAGVNLDGGMLRNRRELGARAAIPADVKVRRLLVLASILVCLLECEQRL